MGRVYADKLVFDGRVPEIGAHRQAAKSILSDIKSDPIASTSLDVMVLGSTTTGNETRRSDVDVLMVASFPVGRFRDPVIELARKAFKRANGLAPVEAKLFLDDDWIRNRPVGLDPMFAQHLIDSADSHPDFVHGNPIHPGIRDFAVDIRNLRESEESVVVGSALSLMQYKKRLFQKAYITGDGEVDLEVMQRAMEFPKSAGRRIAELCALVDESRKEFDITDRESMQHGLRRVAETAVGYEALLEKHDLLVSYDHEYDVVLERALVESRVGSGEYNQWIRALYDEVCLTAWQLAEMWEQYVKDFASEYQIPIVQTSDGASYYY